MTSKLPLLLVSILFISFASANLNIFPKSLSDAGTNVEYEFNATSDAACLNVLLSSGNQIITINSDGVGYYSWDISSLNGTIPQYLCVLKDHLPLTGSPFTFSDIVLNSIRVNQIYSKNITTTSLQVNGNINSNSINVTKNVTANWFVGLFNFFIKPDVSQSYLNFNGSDLSFSETFLNSTIDSRAIIFNSTNLLNSINTTYNIQNLLNSTGIYTYAYNHTLDVFNNWNSTWDNSYGNIWFYNQTLATYNIWGSNWYNHTLSTYNTWNDVWSSTYNTTYHNSINSLSANDTSINTTLNIQNLYNITASMISNYYQSVTNQTISDYNLTMFNYVNANNLSNWNYVNANNLSNFNYVNNRVIALNTTANIGVLYNYTASMIANLSINQLNWTFSLIANTSILQYNASLYNYLPWNVSGTNVFLNNPGDNVGIGTTNPSVKLDVYGSAIQLYNETAGGTAGFYIGSKNSGGISKYFNIFHNGTDATNGALFIIPNSLVQSNAIVTFQSGGNVGIGTTSPLDRLTISGASPQFGVNSSFAVDGQMRFYSDSVLSNMIYRPGSTSDMRFYIGGDKMTINGSTGNVGIGTTIPTAKLSFGTVAEDKIYLYQGATAAASVGFGLEIGGMSIFTDGGATKLYFRRGGSGGANSSVIDAAGRFGINTTTPAYMLEIDNNAKSLNVSGNLYVNSSNVGIGTTTPLVPLDVAGDVNLNNAAFTAAGTLNRGYYVYKSGTTAYGMKLQYTGTEYGTMIFGPNQASRFIGFGKVGALLEDDNMIEYMRLDLDNGNLGIGTTNPAQTLSVVGTLNVTGGAASLEGLYIDTNGNVGIGTNAPLWNGGVSSRLLHIHSSTAAQWAGFHLTNAETGAVAGDGSIWEQIGANAGIYNYENGNLTFNANGATGLMVLTSLGNVGIGTIVPNSTLSIIGNMSVSGNLSANKFIGNGAFLTGILMNNLTLSQISNLSINQLNWTYSLIANTSAGQYQAVTNASMTNYNLTMFNYVNANNLSNWNYVNAVNLSNFNSAPWNESGTNVFLNNIGNNVGIGTSTPTATLEIKNSTTPMDMNISSNLYVNNTYFAVFSDRTYSGLPQNSLRINKNEGVTVYGGLKSYLGNTELSGAQSMTKIGEVNPTYFEINGITNLAETSGGSAFLITLASIDIFSSQIYNYTFGVNRLNNNNFVILENVTLPRMTIQKGTGNFGIGTTNPLERLSVAGSINQTGALSCGLSTDASGKIICTSDERLKNILGNSNYGLNEIMKINPIKFNFKNETYTHIGFSAQNIQKVIPEATPLQNDGYLGLDTNAITATLVNAIKELNNKMGFFEEERTYNGRKLEEIKLNITSQETRIKNLEKENNQMKTQNQQQNETINSIKDKLNNLCKLNNLKGC